MGVPWAPGLDDGTPEARGQGLVEAFTRGFIHPTTIS